MTKSKEDIIEEIFKHYVGKNRIDSFIDCQEKAWKNGYLPEGLEKKDLPVEIKGRLQSETTDGVGIKIERTDNGNNYLYLRKK